MYSYAIVSNFGLRKVGIAGATCCDIILLVSSVSWFSVPWLPPLSL
jgi:hypothetical protein